MQQYFDIWDQWAELKSTTTLPLWGHNVMWWGRAGKLLQFTAGLAVILDLIGPESIVEMGKSIRSAPSIVDNVLRFVLETPEYPADIPLLQQVPWALFGYGPKRAVGLTLLAAYGIFAGFVLQEDHTYGSVVIWFAVLPILPYLLVVGILILREVVIILGRIIQISTRPITEAVAGMFDQPRPAHPLRLVALVLFIMGFNFDLLAS